MKNAIAPARSQVTVATETWIAVALLHREHPERGEFTVLEIVDRVKAERITGSLRPGVKTHAAFHMVANRSAKPAKLRMLYEPRRGLRRLFREGDEANPERTGRSVPKAEAVPSKYRYLLDWYRSVYNAPVHEPWLQGVQALIGAGREIFAGVDADQFVRQLREGWN